MKILVTRPREDGEDIAHRLAAMGHQALVAPLLATEFLEGPTLDLTGVQAALVTSANGARALARRSARRDIAVFAVGPQSAQAARDAGFSKVQSADGDAVALAEAVSRWAAPEGGLLLHVAGEAASGALCEELASRGFKARREFLYRMAKITPLSPATVQAIRDSEVDAALFFSPQSAALFADCMAQEGLSTDRMIAVCISTNTARVLGGLTFAEIRVAVTPNQDALLACL